MGTFVSSACADPDNFVSGGGGVQVQNCAGFVLLLFFFLLFFLLILVVNLTNTAGHHWPGSETPFEWRFAVGPRQARHYPHQYS